MTPSSEPAPASRRPSRPTVVVVLVMVLLLTAGTWWAGQARSILQDVRLVPTSMVCGDVAVPFTLGDHDDATPRFRLPLVPDRACTLTVTARNDGDRPVHLRSFSSELLDPEAATGLEPDPSTDELHAAVRDGRVELDVDLEPEESLDVTVLLRPRADLCTSRGVRHLKTLGRVDVSRWGRSQQVPAQGGLDVQVTTDDFSC